MARYNRSFTEQKRQKWEKENRGQGTMENYLPWLTTHDVPNGGRKHRVPGNRVNRIYELFSDIEYESFCIFDFSSNVVDIKEQYPLDREVTRRIAGELGIIHPKDPKTQVDIVMTSDFVLTLENSEAPDTVVRAIKPFEKLSEFRVLEKLEIERRYWEEQNIDWDIITERQINRVLASNIAMVRGLYHLERTEMFSDISEKSLARIKNELKALLTGNVKIREVCNLFDDTHGLKPGCALSIAKHLIATKRILCDMQSKKLEFDKIQEIHGENIQGVLKVI